MALSEVVLTIDDVNPIKFYGQNDSQLNILKEAYTDLNITSRGRMIKVTGDKKRVQSCKKHLELMVRVLKQYDDLSVQTVRDIVSGTNPLERKLSKGNQNVILYGRNGKRIVSRTKNQKKLIEASDNHDIVFAVGPAGTGKTYTAVALAVRALKRGSVNRIVLTRPAVEAGESLGFLPGGLKEKIDPYLRPLYDALEDMIDSEKLTSFIKNGIIEVAPLAFMRGRTLDRSFIILDEAQNCTETQLRMFLTRLGPSAKCIVTGDMSQIDLPRNQRSGLMNGLHILNNIDGIAILHLTSEDVVRHRLVRQIIDAYNHQTQGEAKLSKREEGRANTTARAKE